MDTQRSIITFTIIASLAIPVLFNFPWTGSDFVAAALLLVSTGCTFDVVTRKFTSQTQRIMAGALILLIAIYIWAELAVGIFTNIGS